MFTRETAAERKGARRIRLKIVGDGVTGVADTLRLQQGETVKDLAELISVGFKEYGVKLKWRWKVRNPQVVAKRRRMGSMAEPDEAAAEETP